MVTIVIFVLGLLDLCTLNVFKFFLFDVCVVLIVATDSGTPTSPPPVRL